MTRFRPGQRPMRALPVLEPRRRELETCVFCPKLCRTACPVSNADPRETVTPWGKMSLSWMVAQGDVPLERATAAPAWACTGCFACRELCAHRNPVTDVLLEARGALSGRGVAPEGARRALVGFGRHEARTRSAARALGAHPGLRESARDALLVGCAYLRGAKREAGHAIDAATTVTGGPVALVESCCGLPLRLGGDRLAFRGAAHTLARALARHERVVVVDAGCAQTLRQAYPAVGVPLAPRVELLVEIAARSLSRLTPGDAVGPPQRGPVRWHDPCQLGRGLGLYDPPRAVLGHLLGRPPDEFERRREQASCSGAGGLLPRTTPGVARAIADARIDEHARAGGGRLVTACAASLLSLRRQGRRAGVLVEDLVTWIARGARGRAA